MAVRDEIKTFVQKTLGCGCPEEVFRHIDWEAIIESPEALFYSRINIGNRLLVYISTLDPKDMSSQKFSALISKGKEERDRLGFNRFRLVIGTDNPDDVRKIAVAMFEGSGKDEKMHLHIIHANDIPAFHKDRLDL
jgi:hypothetical protein